MQGSYEKGLQDDFRLYDIQGILPLRFWFLYKRLLGLFSLNS